MDDNKPFKVGDRVFRHVFDDYVTENDAEKAKEELNETPERREAALQSLKEMLTKDEDLNPCTDDEFLLRFLRVRKFCCEEAFKSIQTFYKFRLKHPKLFQYPSKMDVAVKGGIVRYLPYRDVQGRIVFNFKVGCWNTEQISYRDLLTCAYVLAENLLDNPVNQINGFVAIYDFRGCSIAHFREIVSVETILMTVGMLQNYMPARFKGFFIVNYSRLFKAAYRIVQPFMKEKFSKRVVFSSSNEDFHNYFEPSILPKEYGGTLPDYDFEMMARMIEKKNSFQLDRAFGYK